jgi:uncharacterized protein YlxW (UPF0749 family)
MVGFDLSGWLVKGGEVGAEFVVEAGFGRAVVQGGEEVVYEGVGEEYLGGCACVL